jgi:hypothetical protein
MTAVQTSASNLRPARSPFVFNSAAHLLRIGRERAHNLQELLEGINACPEASIFQHCFQTLQEHHFIREGFSNDFAQWAQSACNETGLAERLSALDIREFTSLRDLRERLVNVVSDYLNTNTRARECRGVEPFYFCSSETVVIPTNIVAHNLADFIEGMRKVSLHSIHFHFVNSRLRLKLDSNDFSQWLAEELSMPKLADKVNRIDIYTSTLEGVRRSMLRILEAGLASPEAHMSANNESQPAA